MLISLVADLHHSDVTPCGSIYQFHSSVCEATVKQIYYTVVFDG